MGYIAYAAGTLIVAVFIHSIWNKTTQTTTETANEAIRSDGHGQKIQQDQLLKQVEERKHSSHTIPVPTFELHKDSDQDVKDATIREDYDSQWKQNAGTDTFNGTYKSGTQFMPPPPTFSVKRDETSTLKTTKPDMPPPSLSVPRRAPSIPSAAASARQGGLQKPSGFSNLAPPPSAASSLRVPQQKVLVNTKMQPANTLSTSTQHPSSRPSRKVILSPGHSPLDWAALTKDPSPTAPVKLRGVNAVTELGPLRMGRIPHKRLKQQTGRKGKDAWTSYQGKVYNISAYLDFHPGGKDELMKGAGRSSDHLFAEVHPWVNWDGMLAGCLIGMLVSDDDPMALGNEADNDLDEMD